jgi:hypothetical protein
MTRFTYDGKILPRQLDLVRNLLADGEWWTIGELEQMLSQPAQSISARIRDLRKKEFGGFIIDREHIVDGIYEYKMVF